MSRVLIVKIDGEFPNLALEKVRKYYSDRGHEVYDNPQTAPEVDQTYVSCIFFKNKGQCEFWEDKAEVGGSGWDFKLDEDGRLVKVRDTTLPKEIEEVKPRINIGFTSRGCIRKCPFCVVPLKEGKWRAIGDIYDIWDGVSKDIILLDNNILSSEEHFFKITDQIKKENLKVDFNQGLDARLLTEAMVKRLSEIRTFDYRFAFDNILYRDSVIKAIKLIKKYGLSSPMWYVYCGKDDFESALERIIILKRHKQRPYLMPNTDEVKGIKKFQELRSWVNSMKCVQVMDFYDFLKYHEKGYFPNKEKLKIMAQQEKLF